MNGFFITGTDTGIGKTVLSALLLAELRRRGINTAPMKPVQTGCLRKPETGNLKPEENQKSEFQVSSFKSQVSHLFAPDLDYCLSMAGMSVSDEDRALMSPYQFEPACSPHLAAELAGTEIEIAKITRAAETLESNYECLIVEGAGGVLVPLNRQETMLDLMASLKLPVILAVRPGLGTINHTLLSLRVLREAKLDVAGVVFIENRPSGDHLIEADNAATIEQFGGVSLLGTIPYCPQLQVPAVHHAELPVPLAAAIEKIANRLNCCF